MPGVESAALEVSGQASIPEYTDGQPYTKLRLVASNSVGREFSGENPNFTARIGAVIGMINGYRDRPETTQAIAPYILGIDEEPQQSKSVIKIFPDAARYKMLSSAENDKLLQALDAGVEIFLGSQESDSEAVLSGEDEGKLCQAVAAHDVLIACNLGLISKVVYSLPLTKGLQDTAREGFLGLQKAVRLYDRSKDSSLSTYALPWITSYARRAPDSRNLVDIPDGAQSNLRLINTSLEALQEHLGRNPSIDELFDHANGQIKKESKRINRGHFMELLGLGDEIWGYASLYAPVGRKDGEDRTQLMDLIPNPNSPDPGLFEEDPISTKYGNFVVEITNLSELTESEGQVISLSTGTFLPSLRGKRFKVKGKMRTYEETFVEEPGGLSKPEISILLGIKEDSVQKRLRSALNKMSRAVVKHGIEPPRST